MWTGSSAMYIHLFWLGLGSQRRVHPVGPLVCLQSHAQIVACKLRLLGRTGDTAGEVGGHRSALERTKGGQSSEKCPLGGKPIGLSRRQATSNLTSLPSSCTRVLGTGQWEPGLP